MPPLRGLAVVTSEPPVSNSFWREDVVQFALDRDVEGAVAEQRAILDRDPTNASACFALGTLSHFKGDTEQAIPYFQKSLAADPAHAASHLSLGRIYAVRGDYELAWKHARAAERLGQRDLVEMLERYPNLH